MNVPFSLSKYLIKVFTQWFLMTAGALGSVFMIVDLIELLRRTSTKTAVPFVFILKMIAYRFPNYLQELSPFIIFFASLLAFWQLNRHRELLVLRASGISIWQILFPLGSTVFFFGAIDLLVINPFAAKLLSKFHKYENTYIYENQTPFSISEQGFWVKEILENRHIILHARHFDQKQEAFYKPTIYIFDSKDNFIERLDAQVAFLKKGYLTLQQGWHTQKENFPQSFPYYSLPTLLSVENLKKSFSDPKTLTFYSLRSYANLLENSGLSASQYFMQWHALVARLGWFIIMVVLAATFTVAPLQEKKTTPLLIRGLLVTFLLYFLKDVTYALGNAGTVPPLLAAWVPVSATGLLALTKLLYSEDG